MLSIPHMIVVFVVVLVVFGPQKLPELARGLGKLMAEFRKASTDFKVAFEEEMRDLERQAREVERKKLESPAAPPAEGPSESQSSGASVSEPAVTPAGESIPRSSKDDDEAKTGDLSASVPSDTTHDHQQPA